MTRLVGAGLRLGVAGLLTLIFSVATTQAQATPSPLTNDLNGPAQGAKPQSNAGGATTAAVPGAGQGFTLLFTDAVDRPSYTVRLVESTNVGIYRSTLEEAAAEIRGAGGPSLTIAPGTISAREPLDGEILLSVMNNLKCNGGAAAGCTAPIFAQGENPIDGKRLVEGAKVQIAGEVETYKPEYQRHVIDHELGHALGLAHEESAYEGELQVMHPSSYSATGYRAGDRNGITYLAPQPHQAQLIAGFQDINGELFGYKFASSPGFPLHYAMATGTSPSVDYGSGTGYVMAFQASNHELRIFNAYTDRLFETHLTMAAGTNPSIAADSEGRYVVAFQSIQGQLWTYSSTQGAVNTGLGMRTGTSPSVADNFFGSYVAAFQSNQGQLWVYSPAGSFSNTNLYMQAGTSPSIAVESGRYVAAFQSIQGQLWTYSSSAGALNTGLSMKTGTSPSVASEFYGSYISAFQSYQGQLWVFSPAGGAFNLTLGMQGASSPSIAVAPGGNYVAGFESNQNQLWTYSSAAGYNNTGLSMQAGTSPSITFK